MIPNCRGCELEYSMLMECLNEGMHFAGSGLFEKGHLFIRMVNDKGEILVE